MAGLCPPLPTLRRRPRGRRRTARGRCGSLLLHRSGLAPPTPCRSPGALRVLPPQPASLVFENPSFFGQAAKCEAAHPFPAIAVVGRGTGTSRVLESGGVHGTEIKTS